jgi:hypothetical protein
MNPNQDRKEALFETARQLASRAERAAYLDEACGDDLALRRQIEAMLETEAAADQYFRTTEAPGEAVREAALNTPAAFAEPLAEGPGATIGRYKLLQQIGEGGFGVVYMAEQREPVVRKVALKVIKLGMDTKQVVARFEAERQALALMDHPNIARIFDAGVTGAPEGRNGETAKGRKGETARRRKGETAKRRNGETAKERVNQVRKGHWSMVNGPRSQGGSQESGGGNQ